MMNIVYGSKENIEEKVCLVCCPSLAKAMHDDWGYDVTLLDIDTRFKDLPGFQYWDLKEPVPIEGKKFDMILMDPPFFSVNSEEQAHAMSVLANQDYSTKLLLSWPKKDEYPLC